MELNEAIKNRRSIRKYNDVPVSEEDIRAIIDAAIHAPSACNLQLWKFIVINDTSVIRNIYEKGGASFLKSVHQAIVVAYDNQTDNLEYKDYIESAAAAIQNMLLKSTELGIGTCWVNNLPNKNVLRRILKIPRWYDPIALVSIGHYSDEPLPMERKFNLKDIISYNEFGFDTQKKNLSKIRFRRLARSIYKVFPFKRLLDRFADRYEKKFNN